MHTFIAGMTGSGKTFLQKSLARLRKSQKYGVLVCDGRMETGWQCDRMVKTGEEMLSLAKRSKRCSLFFSEVASSIGKNGGDLNWFAEESRHEGHRCYFGSQRFTQVDPIIRENCDELFLFRVKPSQAKYWIEQFADEDLLLAGSLPQRHFIWKKPFQKAEIWMLSADGQRLVSVSV